jgi:hypothetical protein
MASQNAEVFRREYALVVFNPNDCAEDTTLRNLDGSWAFRNTRFYFTNTGFLRWQRRGHSLRLKAKPIRFRFRRLSVNRSSALSLRMFCSMQKTAWA